MENINELEINEFETPEVIETIEPEDKAVILEGILYLVGEEGIKANQLAEVMEVSLEEVLTYLKDIEMKYAKKDSALELVSFGGNYKFVTKNAVYEYANKLFQTTKANTLSQSALETLAIIAYKQPVTRIEIEELRGVGSETMIRKLEAKGLIEEVGRSDAPGRPILYGVTEDFMDSFKLYSLDELPDLPNFSSNDSENLFENK